MGKKVLVAVINDLVTDQRVHKTCLSLQSYGYAPLLVGRELKDSQAIKRPYNTHRFKMLFTKGALFYAFYNWRLFWFFLFKKCDLIYANDLDTLLACRWVSKLKRKPLIYDSHECFTEVPELQGRKAKNIWLKIEKSIFPKLKNVLTVNHSIANFYEKKYGVRPLVMRNVPVLENIESEKTREDLGLPINKQLIILQGAGINVDRGAEEMMAAMVFLEDVVWLIVGSGDVIDDLKKTVKQKQLEDRVLFKGKLPYPQMMAYTAVCDAGLTLDKDTNLNYRFSLPNKVFDYIKAKVPVFSSDLPELRKIIEDYQIGSVFSSHEPKILAQELQNFLNNKEQLTMYRANMQQAIEELNWQKESKVLKEIIDNIE